MLKLPANQCAEAFKLTACALPSGALRASGRLTEAHKATLKELYRGLRERFEGSPAAARIPLTFLEGQELRESLGELDFLVLGIFCRRVFWNGAVC